MAKGKESAATPAAAPIPAEIAAEPAWQRLYRTELVAALRVQGHAAFAPAVEKTPYGQLDEFVERYFTAGPGRGKELSFEASPTPVQIYDRVAHPTLRELKDYPILVRVLEEYSAPEKVKENPDGFMQKLMKAAEYSREFGQKDLASYINNEFSRKMKKSFPKNTVAPPTSTAPSSIDEVVAHDEKNTVLVLSGKTHRIIVSATLYQNGKVEYGVRGREV